MMQVEDQAGLGQLAVCLRGLVYGGSNKAGVGTNTLPRPANWLPAFQQNESTSEGQGNTSGTASQGEHGHGHHHTNSRHHPKVRSLPQVGGKPTHRKKNEGGCDVPGWVTLSSPNTKVTLKRDIVDFVNYMQLSEQETEERDAVVASVTQCIAMVKPEAVVSDPFKQIALPGARVDLMVRNAGDFGNLATLLTPHTESPKHETDGTVAFTFRKFSVCLKEASLTDVEPIIGKYLEEIPQLRATIVLIQAILQQCNLVHVVGGLDLWTLIVMLVAVYVRYNSVENSASRLFMDFLACFGWAFDYAMHGVDLNLLSSGSNWPVKQHDSFLSVSDPLNPSVNLSASASRAQQLRATFQYCYVSLSKWEHGNTTHKYISPLANIIAHKKLPARPSRPVGS
eukprot:TRINITY_DN1420_c1_g2_i1.p1 TRINITY_DN1420_c1_g2~~TRINITY_DN1420_c1_g2_i1.p1  ORF type:complete len:396 (+),score=36.86 TRINITY_DN1420_c1_g2_i1:90-1277(+)